ncbi:MAG: peptidylprolyl isomerase [Longimicrobiales bacterium]
MNARRMIVPALAVALGACQGSEGRAPSPDTLARAGGAEFTTEAAAEILAPQVQLPNQPQVVEALTNLWVDYFLLAKVAAQDTTLSSLDVSSLVEQSVNQELVLRLRDQVVPVDTAISEEELQDVYERDLPGSRVRARHILLRFPPGATEAQTDSVRTLAESLRARLEGGEDFEALAREYSEDTGSGANGGDLGSFGKGEMVPPFEEAAFALPVGEISPVVETTFGLHIIRVDERIIPPLGENREQFRAQLQNRRVAEAESTYVAGVIEAAEIEVDKEGFETARRLAETPGMELTRRARDRALVTFAGGEYTVQDFQDWLLFRPGSLRGEVQAATDEQLDGLFRNLTRERLLIQEARAEGIQVSQAKKDSLATAIRVGVKGVAGQLGFLGLAPREGESLDEAVYAAVQEVLLQVVQGDREVIPLGGVSFALKKQFDARINESAFDRAVARVTELRTQVPPIPPQTGVPPAAATPVVPDTGGPQG